MPDNDSDLRDDDGFPGAPESRTVDRRRTRLSVVWLIPIVAAIIGGWIAVTRILDEGPTITIEFRSADRLEAGKTKVEYNGVQVGTVSTVQLSKDHEKVITTVKMFPKTEDLLVEDTSFWIVRPRISGASVTGLGTLVSGAYIGMEIGKKEEARRHFEALESPPIVTLGVPGRFFSLKAPDLGSLERGTPLYFRRLKVGEVESYELEKGGRSFRIKVFVHAPYDQYVTPDTRFWNASGIDLSLAATGLTLRTESIESILIGGIAFETPATSTDTKEAEGGASFTLFKDRATAFARAARDPQKYVLVFEQPVRGLSVGAPVEFRGIQIGDVLDIDGRLDQKSFEFSVQVTITVDPERFGIELRNQPADFDLAAYRKVLMNQLVSRGVRAQLRSGSLLTGALYVAFDFFPDAAHAEVDWSTAPARLPTTPGLLEGLETSIAGIVKKIDALPIEEIGDNLDKAIVELDRTLASARGTVDDVGTLVEPNSVLGQQLDSTLQEVSGAARSVRVLADFLERHPEALLRGKKGEAK